MSVKVLVFQIQSVLDISNADISKYPFIPKNIIDAEFLFLFTFQLLLSQTTDI